jgi:two-component system LytT family sensor kinase
MTDVTYTWSLPSGGAAWSDDGAVAQRADGDTRGRWGWLRILLGAFAAYTVIVLLTIVQGAYYAMNGGAAVPWRAMIAGRCLDNYACALFVPVFFWLVHRYPIDRQHWRRSVPLLLAASLAFTLLKFAALLPINRALWSGPIGMFRSAQLANSIGVLLDFWAVIGIAHAIEFYRRSQERERTATQLRSQLAHAQLEALRAQLHPHFLFNTLNGVATLMHRDASGADQMLTNLAELLRETLHHTGADEIPLSDELALLDRYLAILQTRFGDRLTVVRDIAPDIGDVLVPHFVLQPLVENALEHGIAQRPGPGRVEIRAARDGDRVRITITDDGLGLSPAGSSGVGVGLANTRARLSQLYGSAQGLSLESVAPTGTRATVTLPYRVRGATDALTGDAAAHP